jgi:hypothetical protein
MSARALLLALLGVTGCATVTAGSSEYEVKAAYVYNFAKFIDWPSTESAADVTICVYGKDPFGGFLDEAVRGKLAHGLPLAIRRLPTGSESWEGCQVLFLGMKNVARVEPILKRLEGRSILTIAELDGFAEGGGMLGLRFDGGTVRFDINLAAIAAARLQASSRLIEIGRVVGPRK